MELQGDMSAYNNKIIHHRQRTTLQGTAPRAKRGDGGPTKQGLGLSLVDSGTIGRGVSSSVGWGMPAGGNNIFSRHNLPAGTY